MRFPWFAKATLVGALGLGGIGYLARAAEPWQQEPERALDVRDHPDVTRRQARLDEEGLLADELHPGEQIFTKVYSTIPRGQRVYYDKATGEAVAIHDVKTWERTFLAPEQEEALADITFRPGTHHGRAERRLEERLDSIDLGYYRGAAHWLNDCVPIAGHYVGVLRKIAASEGVPTDFPAIGIVEAGLCPHLVSPAGARGMFQMMPAAERQFAAADPDYRRGDWLQQARRAFAWFFVAYDMTRGHEEVTAERSWLAGTRFYHAGPGNYDKADVNGLLLTRLAGDEAASRDAFLRTERGASFLASVWRDRELARGVRRSIAGTFGPESEAYPYKFNAARQLLDGIEETMEQYEVIAHRTRAPLLRAEVASASGMSPREFSFVNHALPDTVPAGTVVYLRAERGVQTRIGDDVTWWNRANEAGHGLRRALEGDDLRWLPGDTTRINQYIGAAELLGEPALRDALRWHKRFLIDRERLRTEYLRQPVLAQLYTSHGLAEVE